jgi:SSS family solute:Na+ symporter
MNMHWFEWCIVLGMIAFMVVMALRVQRSTQGVADFLAANRTAGRYVICIAHGIMQLGAISIIGNFQRDYRVGFGANWWGNFSMPIGMLIIMSGWLVYRYRETRAMTLGQLFEMRYSKKFRVFAGSLCFFSGVINFGIFPAVGAQFFIMFCGFPENLAVGPVTVGTFPVVMFVLLGLSLFFTISGGQVTVLVVDFIQGMFSNIILFGILIVILIKFSLSDIFEALLMAPEGQSMVNPFEIGKIPDFNIWYFVINFFIMIYGTLAWQGSAGYNASARNAHEAKLAGVIGQFRSWGFGLAFLLLPLCAFTIMHHPQYSDQGQQAQQVLDAIDNEQVQSQMITPVAMTVFLPPGFIGGLAAVMFCAFISTHTTYLHSWGSIFIQDVIVPLRKKPLSPERHLLYLRLSICGVAAFIFLFSMVFTQTIPINLFFMFTGSIWLGGAGAVIIGALYWKKGTTSAAWVALILGAVIPLAYLICDQIWIRVYGEKFWIGPKEVTTASMALAVGSYILISLYGSYFGKIKPFNLNKMLHRDRSALDKDNANVESGSNWSIKKYFGYSSEFTFGDRFIYGMAIGKLIVFFSLFIIMTIVALFFKISDRAWATYHRYFLWFQISLAFVFAVWVTIGGIIDIRKMLSALKTAKRDARDDGTVVDGHNLDEEPFK